VIVTAAIEPTGSAHSAPVEGESAGETRLSLRGLARELGVSEKAVRNGVKSGRLHGCLERDEAGRVSVFDLALARREWRGNAGKPARMRAEPQDSAADAGDEQPTGVVISASTLNEAQRLATIERARRLRLENDLREGQLVEVSRASKEAFESARIIREAMLNLPARLAGELAAETDATAVHLRLDAAIREALGAASVQLEVAEA
jgi:hypothetical protein